MTIFPIWSRRFGIRTKLKAMWATPVMLYFSVVFGWIALIVVFAFSTIGFHAVMFPETKIQVINRDMKADLPPKYQERDVCDLLDPVCVARVRAEVCIQPATEPEKPVEKFKPQKKGNRS